MTTTTSTNIFDNLPAMGSIGGCILKDELNDYLKEPHKYVVDVIQWWYNQCKTWLCLSQMALDHLSIPGTFPSSFKH